MPLQTTDIVAVEMTAGEWQGVLAGMGKATYETVAPLIMRITQQLMAKQEQIDQAQTTVLPQPNGGLAADLKKGEIQHGR